MENFLSIRLFGFGRVICLPSPLTVCTAIVSVAYSFYILFLLASVMILRSRGDVMPMYIMLYV